MPINFQIFSIEEAKVGGNLWLLPLQNIRNAWLSQPFKSAACLASSPVGHGLPLVGGLYWCSEAYGASAHEGALIMDSIRDYYI